MRERIIAAARRYLPIPLATAAIFGALGWLASSGGEPEYTASANVILRTATIDPTIGGGFPISQDPERTLATEAELAGGPAIDKRAAAAFRERLGPQSQLPVVSIVADPLANLLRFEATGSTARGAFVGAEAYAQAYIDYREQQETTLVTDALRAVEREIALSRSQGVSEDQIAGLIERRDTLIARQAVTGGGATLHGPQSVSEESVGSGRVGFLGAILGLALGIALVLARRATSTRVESGQELEERLGIPLLGWAPVGKRVEKQGLAVALTAPASFDAERYRMLAASIEMRDLAHGASSFIVGDAIDPATAASTAANLGVVLARRGLDVILLDMDGHGSTVERLAPAATSPGLAEVLSREASIEEALKVVDLTGPDDKQDPDDRGGRLRLLARLNASDSAHPLAGGSALEAVIADLDERCDVLIVHVPPLLRSSEAFTLLTSTAPYIDFGLVSVVLGALRRQEVDVLRRSLAAVSVPLHLLAVGEPVREDGEGYWPARFSSAGSLASPDGKGASQNGHPTDRSNVADSSRRA